MAMRGVFPGSFDPLTTAHLAVADAAHDQLGLDRLDLVLSEVALAKEAGHAGTLAERLETIRSRRGDRRWLDARATTSQLLVDIAEGYDVLVIGADKWPQLHDPAFYGGSTSRRDAALARLPPVAVAPRAGHLPPEDPAVVLLDVDPVHHGVSASAVRAGRADWRA